MKNDGRGRLGGRQKGTPNKTTSTIRDSITMLLEEYHGSGKFSQDLSMLDPETRICVMEKYAQYVCPKMKSVDIDMTFSGTVHTIEDRLRELCGGTDKD